MTILRQPENFIEHIHDELLDAARIDGCNEFKIMW